MVGVNIAQHECVAPVEEVEERRDVEGIARSAGGGRRYVDVDDVSWVVFDEDGDAKEFHVAVVGVDAAEIEVGVRSGVVDEEAEAAAAVSASVPTSDGVVGEVR